MLNVTALRARDMSWRQETPGPGSAARPCHGNSPARGGGWRGSPGVKATKGLGSSSFPFPERQLVPPQLIVPLDGVTVTQLGSL